MDDNEKLVNCDTCLCSVQQTNVFDCVEIIDSQRLNLSQETKHFTCDECLAHYLNQQSTVSKII